MADDFEQGGSPLYARLAREFAEVVGRIGIDRQQRRLARLDGHANRLEWLP